MPKKLVGREQTVTDIRDILNRIDKDYPGWEVSLDITMGRNQWIQIVGIAKKYDEGGTAYYVTARVWHTERSPSYMTDQWKALIGLYSQLQRHEDGLPPLLGY